MTIQKALSVRLQKAKYLKRWRGKDGKYRYLYKQAKKKAKQKKEEKPFLSVRKEMYIDDQLSKYKADVSSGKVSINAPFASVIPSAKAIMEHEGAMNLPEAKALRAVLVEKGEKERAKLKKRKKEVPKKKEKDIRKFVSYELEQEFKMAFDNMKTSVSADTPNDVVAQIVLEDMGEYGDALDDAFEEEMQRYQDAGYSKRQAKKIIVDALASIVKRK